MRSQFKRAQVARELVQDDDKGQTGVLFEKTTGEMIIPEANSKVTQKNILEMMASRNRSEKFFLDIGHFPTIWVNYKNSLTWIVRP